LIEQAFCIQHGEASSSGLTRSELGMRSANFTAFGCGETSRRVGLTAVLDYAKRENSFTTVS
jgi:hypothetical protein